MSKYILFKQKFHKWYDDDIWGQYAVSNKNTKALRYLYTSFKHNFAKRRLVKKKKFFLRNKRFRSFYKERFLYQINATDEEFIRRRRGFKAKHFFNQIKLRIFYGNMKVKPFKSLLKTKLKIKNAGSGAVTLFLEGRLDTLLYRTNLFSSIFALKKFIWKNYIFINGLGTNENKIIIQIGDIITISPQIYSKLHNEFFQKLKKNKILTNFPSYLEVNYFIGSLILVKKPEFNEISYPFIVPTHAILHQFIK